DEHLIMSWARKMIDDDAARRAVCDHEFAAADKDGSGDLEVSEVVDLVFKICESMSIKMLQREKVAQLVQVCDKSKDGSLQLNEFRAAFKAVLKSCVHEAEVEGATTTTTTTTTEEVEGTTTTTTMTTTTIQEVEVPQPMSEAEPLPKQPAREELELRFSRRWSHSLRVYATLNVAIGFLFLFFKPSRLDALKNSCASLDAFKNACR
ncbi:unnamed protein product, partial [Polarella glacialis]